MVLLVHMTRVALKRIGPDLSFYYIVLTETNGSCSRFSDSFSNTDKSIVFAYILVLSAVLAALFRPQETIDVQLLPFLLRWNAITS